MIMSKKILAASALCLGGILMLALSSEAAPDLSNQTCEDRQHHSASELVECIQQHPLFTHLVAFQKISDHNPGPNGHGNRNTGTPGYKASVDYVAALMRKAGYRVTIQPYNYIDFILSGVPTFTVTDRSYTINKDWYVARLSGQGAIAAPVQPVGVDSLKETPSTTLMGCSASDFSNFTPGNIALIEHGACEIDVKVKNAEAAHAAAVIVFNSPGTPEQEHRRGITTSGGAFQAYLHRVATIPVLGVISNAVGTDLYRQYRAGRAPTVRVDIRAQYDYNAIDYNLIADSPLGDPNHVVVVEAHLDAIYGAGILDNASGSSTILEIALKMAKTPTRNQLRYIWFGGEEINLLGSAYYTQTLPPQELAKIVFDVDADVTATPNYAVLIADPMNAHNAERFPPNVIPASKRGNQYFQEYFTSLGVPSRPASFGNDGTDSNSFSLVGIPNTGILTQQDCCKSPAQVKLWGGFVGNYEGDIPSFNGGCVDQPRRWCDNLDNNSPQVLEFISKAVAYVTFKLANDADLNPSGN